MESFDKVQWLTVDEGFDGQRLDNFLIRELKGVPKSHIYRLLRKGEVRVNKGRKRAEYRLKTGDQLRLPPIRLASAKTPAKPGEGLQQLLSESVFYEDDGMLVINKPSGLAVHGGSGINLGLIEAMRAIRPELKHLELVHRLDRDTSGCIMLAKKRSVLKALHQQLQGKTIQKNYLALVNGRWPAALQKVDARLQKNTLGNGERIVRVMPEGKASLTEYAIRKRFKQHTLVQASPVTGRTHQIRVHCRFAGHPICCDEKYGDRDKDRIVRDKGLKRLFLHAESLVFESPLTGRKVAVEAPLDDELEQLLEQLD